jgi:TupA-like ATPgrasp
MTIGNRKVRSQNLMNSFIRRILPPKILSLIRKLHINYDVCRTYLIVHLIKASPHSAFNNAPRIGYLRGIDFYKGSKLISTIAFAMRGYRGFHGVYPSLLKPTYFDEKLFKSKFFTEFKVPESGNKLFTSSFIPVDLKTSINVATIVWHSPLAKLPRNNEIKPGYYYLKASHGSGMFKRIRYPLREDEFISLERTCEQWLGNEFGLTWGEWWYNTFEKEILIEEQVGTENDSISWYFYAFDGVIGHITAHKKTNSGDELTWFNENFEVLGYQDPKFRRIKNISPTQDTKDKLKQYASLVGRQFKFVRVDLLVNGDQKIYLAELTFSPTNALNSFPNERQTYLGSLWSQD